MSMARRVGVVCFLIAMTAAGAHAQMHMNVAPPMRGILKSVVGSGGQYEISTPKGTEMVREMAIVGKESVGGKDAYWFENSMSNTPMGEMVTKQSWTANRRMFRA
jgi:hypothetical protein